MITLTTDNESDDIGLSLFKTQFQEAAKDLCLMLSNYLLFKIFQIKKRMNFFV